MKLASFQDHASGNALGHSRRSSVAVAKRTAHRLRLAATLRWGWPGGRCCKTASSWGGGGEVVSLQRGAQVGEQVRDEPGSL